MLGLNTMIRYHQRRKYNQAWDDLACRDSLNALLNTLSATHCIRKLYCVAWSKAFLTTNVGNLLSPDELHIAMTLRTGAKILESTKCVCRKIVDELRLGGHSCNKNARCF